MHEPSHPRPAPPWSDLPLLAPPRSAWPGLDAEFRRRRQRRLAWLAMAAMLGLVAVVPRMLTSPPAPVAPEIIAAAPGTDESARIAALMAESAQLEALIAWSREEGVESASAASLAMALEERVERVDLLLSRPEADPAAALPLWQERVLRLRQLAGLQSSEHLLAVNGESESGQPVLAF
jgi:hypothetical protein